MSNYDMQHTTKHKWIILLFDLLYICGAYVLAFFIRYGGFPERNWESFLALLPWILLIGLFFLSIYELYQLERKTVWDIVTGVLVAVIFMAFITMAFSFLFREFALPRSIIVIASLFQIVFLIVWKVSLKKMKLYRRSGTALLIGEEVETNKVIAQIKGTWLKGTKIKHAQPNTNMDKLDELLRQVDYVFVCPALSKEKKSSIIYHAMKAGKSVYVIPTLYELLLTRSTITSVDDTMLMSVQPFGLAWDQQIIKRLFDIVCSFSLLLLLSPLLLCVALAVKLEDPRGRIIYKQERLGLNNEPFMILKFRSMIEGAENGTGPVLAAKDDQRITKVGKLLRLLRLDELPQLFNVLKGDMSIVGPRPERPYFIRQIRKQNANYIYRNKVKPGITGYAQIMGKYSTDVEDKLRYDLYYIRNYTFWLDLIILLRTFIVLLDKTKAEGQTIVDNDKNDRNGTDHRTFQEAQLHSRGRTHHRTEKHDLSV
jgi:exopolysaccharide biosynthesis polyprenyl glycosylphosphotransferase